MKRLGLLKAAAAGMACLGMLLPAPVLRAADTTDSAPAGPQQAPTAIDVALGEGGTLRGQIVDAQGNAVPQAAVSLRQADREVAATVANSSGGFHLTGLRGGTYRIVAGGADGIYRLWAPQTAPPAARRAALVVAGGPQVLGQFGAGAASGAQGPLGHWLSNPWIVAGLVTAAIAIPVGIHNYQIDRNRPPASP